MATMQLAKWATSIPPSLPAPVLHAARRSLYNYLGCAIGGSTHPAVNKAFTALSPLFGAPTSTLLGKRGSNTSHTSKNTSSNRSTADAQHATLLNGIASHVHDYDDTHLATIIHPTGPVASAILAYAELRGSPTYAASSPTAKEKDAPAVVSGQALLAALVMGVEASCKLGLAVWPSHYDLGWHITSTTGSIGAAVAVGRLMGLDKERMAHAIGLAAVQVTGLREMFGSDTKSFHPGRAAQNGLLAAVLAERGFTSSERALEGKRGWGNVVLGPGGEVRFERFLGELGERWEIERNAFKPFPCGIVAHPAIDACIQLKKEMDEKGLAVGDVESVKERVHPLVIELTSKRCPKDGLEGKFSVFHGSAVGLLFGKAGPAQYADEIVTDSNVIELRDRIQAEADERLRADEVVVEVELKGGEKLSKHVEHAIGSLEMPMSDEQLEEKFVDQCELVLGRDEAEEASEAAWKIGEVEDAVEIIKRL